MKKTTKSQKTIKELRPEYRFDYSKSKPNRFAGKVEDDALVVVLDPDVAEVFTSSEAVNTALRALIAVIPNKLQSKNTRK
jgi:hypothetical protein